MGLLDIVKPGVVTGDDVQKSLLTQKNITLQFQR